MKIKLLFTALLLGLFCFSCSDDGMDENPVETKLSISTFSFVPEKNKGKILSKKLYYDVDTYTHYTTDPAKTILKMSVTDGEIVGCIPYLFDKNLVPSISCTPGCSILYSTDEGKTFTAWDGKSAIDFGACNALRISKDGSNQDYKVKITNTGLPIVVLNQPDGNADWSQVGEKVFSKATDFDFIEDNHPGDITIYHADGTVNLKQSTSMARLRGNTTQAFPKKPFAVKLGKKAEVLGMPKHKRWVLLANWKDKSLMRNHIALGIARKFTEHLTDGIPWNVSGEFVELVYNGVHVGNYYMCEQIKIDENRLNIQAEYDAKDYPSLSPEQVANFGYLLECDDNYDEVSKFMTKHYLPFQFKDDTDAGNVIINYVQAKVQDIEDNLYKGFKNADSDAYARAYEDLDLPSVVDQLLIYEMTMNSELGHPKSLYMYMDGTGKLCGGPVWDFDWLAFPINNSVLDKLNGGWDRFFDKSLLCTSGHKNKHFVSSYVPTGPRSDDVPYIWYPMMVTEPSFQDMAASRWNKMLQILTTFAEEIELTAERIADSWEHNNAIWPAYYSANSDRQKYCNGGYCGDEEMTKFADITQALYNTYLERLNGMKFVLNKDWPIWDIR